MTARPGWGGGPRGRTPWGGFDESLLPAAPRPIFDNVEASELGIDIAAVDDLPKSFPLARAEENLGNAIARRLMTPEGALAVIDTDAADYGYDLRGLVNSRARPRDLPRIYSRTEDECRKEERVEEAQVEGVYNFAPGSAVMAIALRTATGTQRLVLGISQVTVRVLSPAPEP